MTPLYSFDRTLRDHEVNGNVKWLNNTGVPWNEKWTDLKYVFERIPPV
jgi:hypothetical protein